jgi:hypothetical protein
MLSMEAQTEQAPGNAQVIPVQNNPGQGTIHSKLSVAHFIILINLSDNFFIASWDDVLYCHPTVYL